MWLLRSTWPRFAALQGTPALRAWVSHLASGRRLTPQYLYPSRLMDTWSNDLPLMIGSLNLFTFKLLSVYSESSLFTYFVLANSPSCLK